MNNSVKARIIGVISFLILLVLILPSLLFPKNDTPITPTYVFMDRVESDLDASKSDNINNADKVNDINDKEVILSLESIHSEKSSLPKKEISLASYSNNKTNNLDNTSENVNKNVSESSDTDILVPEKKLWLRVASLTDKENAKELINTLKSQGYSVKQENVIVNNISYERILVGPFADKVAVNEVIKKLIDDGYSPELQ